MHVTTLINTPKLFFFFFYPNRFRPPGLFIKECNMLHQEDGGALPGGGTKGHPEPSPDIQLKSEVPHLTECGCFSRLDH